MCGEILKDSTAPEVRLYAKTLSNLELSSNETVRTDLQTLLQQLVQVLKPPPCQTPAALSSTLAFQPALESFKFVISH